MKLRRIFTAICLSILFSVIPSSIFAKEVSIPPEIAAYDGKTFAGFQDTEYLSYDQALRKYLVKRIDQQFGVALDPNKYSGFDLLEIEALFKCKKSNEPLNIFLKMFPKRW